MKERRVQRNRWSLLLLSVLLAWPGTPGATFAQGSADYLDLAERYRLMDQYGQALEYAERAWRVARTPGAKSRIRLTQADILVEYAAEQMHFTFPNSDDTSPHGTSPLEDEISPPADDRWQRAYEFRRKASDFYREAIRYAEKSGDRAATVYEAANDLAVLYIETGRPKKAIELVEDYLDSAPPGAAFHLDMNYAVALRLVKRRGDAFDTYVRAAAIARQNPVEAIEAASHLAARHRLTGRSEAAADLIATGRAKGYLEATGLALREFLRNREWFGENTYTSELIEELVGWLVDSAAEAAESAPTDRTELRLEFSGWADFLGALAEQLPAQPSVEIESLACLLESADFGQESDCADLVVEDLPHEFRQSLSELSGVLGQLAFRSEEWERSFRYFASEWELAPKSEAAIGWILHLVASRPEVDPSGEVALSVARFLDPAVVYASPGAEPADPGLLQLAGRALAARSRFVLASGFFARALNDSRAKGTLRLSLADEMSSLYSELGVPVERERILAAFDSATKRPQWLDTPLPDETRSWIESDGFKLGPDNASVTWVHFSDLDSETCSACTPLSVMEPLPSDTEGVQVVYQHYPTRLTTESILSSLVSECVGRQDPQAFWNFRQRVVGAGETSAEKLFAMGRESVDAADLDIERFEECVGDVTSDEHVKAAAGVVEDLYRGRSLGLGESSGWVIDGRVVPADPSDLVSKPADAGASG